MVGRQGRFIANETFTDDETGDEYVQGGIYEISDKNRSLIEKWTEGGMVRDPDVEQSPEDAAEQAKARQARREAEDNDDTADADDSSDDKADDNDEDEPA
jgi:hypothetical protein